ncbi:MAG: hypothetical protein OXC07_09325 [Kistimonas sp.]|nr:hypothetical protein [Kistimonas sp.]
MQQQIQSAIKTLFYSPIQRIVEVGKLYSSQLGRFVSPAFWLDTPTNRAILQGNYLLCDRPQDKTPSADMPEDGSLSSTLLGSRAQSVRTSTTCYLLVGEETFERTDFQLRLDDLRRQFLKRFLPADVQTDPSQSPSEDSDEVSASGGNKTQKPFCKGVEEMIAKEPQGVQESL